MKRCQLLSILVAAITTSFASTTTQPVLLGEISDQTTATVIAPQPSIPEVVQEQTAISNAHDQKEAEISAEEDYFDDMEFGGFDDPFWGSDMMFDGFPDMNTPFMFGPGIMVPIGVNNDNNDSNNIYTSTKPQVINNYYESQTSNGDIIFKQ